MKKLSKFLSVFLSVLIIVTSVPMMSFAFKISYSVTYYNENANTSGFEQLGSNRYVEGYNVTVSGNIWDMKKEGFAFNNWNTQEDGLGTSYMAGDSFLIQGDITLYAQWAKLYSVTFDVQGYGIKPTSQNLKKGEKVSEPQAPTAEGYVFGGWYKDASCINKWDFESDTMSEENITLYAKWTQYDWSSLSTTNCLITLTDTAMTKETAEAIIAKELTNPQSYDIVIYSINGNYAYNGLFYFNNQWTETTVTQSSCIETSKTKNVYIIGTTSAPVISKITSTTTDITPNDTVTVDDNAKAIADNHTTLSGVTGDGFLVYAKNGENYTGILHTDSSWSSTATDKSLADLKSMTNVYVIGTVTEEEEEYAISFGANGGSGVMNAWTTSNKKLTLPANGFTAPEGKEFEGWGIGSTSAETKTVGSEATFSEDTTVYAKWKAIENTKYTVNFDPQEHKCSIDTQMVKSGDKITKPENPVADGYTFAGWYKEADCINPWNFDADTVTNDTVLYAKWTLLEYPEKKQEEQNNNTNNNASSESKKTETVVEEETPAVKAEKVTAKLEGDQSIVISAEITNNKAKVAEITDKNIADITNENKENTIDIDLSEASASVNKIELSRTSFNKLTKTLNDTTNNIDSVSFKTSYATVTVDKTTMNSVLSQANGQSISLVVAKANHRTDFNEKQQAAIKNKPLATTFEAYFESYGQRIGEFKGGAAVVSINYKPLVGTLPQCYHVLYLAEDGTTKRYPTRVNNDRIEFTADHFSDYCIVYDTSVVNETSLTTADTNVTNSTVSTDTYIVKKGDSFWKIAKRYGINLKTLMSLNPELANSKYIYPGQSLVIKH